jgi:hypothetical protein
LDICAKEEAPGKEPDSTITDTDYLGRLFLTEIPCECLASLARNRNQILQFQ